jgi:hypothetical protein
MNIEEALSELSGLRRRHYVFGGIFGEQWGKA